jgi:hypothetical protein
MAAAEAAAEEAGADGIAVQAYLSELLSVVSLRARSRIGARAVRVRVRRVCVSVPTCVRVGGMSVHADLRGGLDPHI